MNPAITNVLSSLLVSVTRFTMGLNTSQSQPHMMWTIYELYWGTSNERQACSTTSTVLQKGPQLPWDQLPNITHIFGDKSHHA